jgi:hypothetical protein
MQAANRERVGRQRLIVLYELQVDAELGEGRRL